MRYFLLLTALSVLSAGAYALSWDSLVSGTGRSIKAFFAPASVKEPPPPARPAAARELPLNLPPAEAKAYLESAKPVLLDVRTAEEYSAGHISGALQLDYYAADFREKLDRMDKNANYLIYCRSGKRSAASLQTMRELGFREIHDIAGGFNAWTAAGYTVVK